MTDTTLPALKGVITRLRAFAALTALVPAAKIVSSVNQQTTFPYVLIEIESEPWDTDDRASMSHAIRVHAFSNALSPAPAMGIITEVYNALNRQEQNITLDTGTPVLLGFTGVKATFKDRDKQVWQGVIEFKLLID